MANLQGWRRGMRGVQRLRDVAFERKNLADQDANDGARSHGYPFRPSQGRVVAPPVVQVRNQCAWNRADQRAHDDIAVDN